MGTPSGESRDVEQMRGSWRSSSWVHAEVRLRALVILAVAGIFTVATAGVARALPPPAGVLTQTGCISTDGGSDNGAGTCVVGTAVDAAGALTVSPDGKNVYVGSGSIYLGPFESDPAGIAVFNRSPATGQLTQLSGTAACATTDGSSQSGPGQCTVAQGLAPGGVSGDVQALAVAPDGDWLYAAAANAESGYPGLLIFARDPATGALTQLPGDAGCITADAASQAGPGTCQTDPLLGEPDGLTFSSDGRFLYVTDGEGRIHVFMQNAQTGGLIDLQCISMEESPPAGCIAGRDLGDSQGLVITPDGTHAYSAGGGSCGTACSAGISVFNRDPQTGGLTQEAGTAGCVSDSGEDNLGVSGSCTQWRVVGGVDSLAVGSDGSTLYAVAGSDNGVAVLHINADGTLTQSNGSAGCITSTGDDNLGAPACATGLALQEPTGSAISADGATLYISSSAGVAVLSVDPSTGALTQPAGTNGCVTSNGSSGATPGQCAAGTNLSDTIGLAVSPDGGSAYTTSFLGTRGSVGLFTRQTAPSCSALSAQTGYGAPVPLSLRCVDADAQPVTLRVASPPGHGALAAIDQATGSVTYTPAAGFSGTDSFTYAASDGTNISAPATATITVAPPAPVTLVLVKHPKTSAGAVELPRSRATARSRRTASSACRSEPSRRWPGGE